MIAFPTNRLQVWMNSYWEKGNMKGIGCGWFVKKWMKKMKNEKRIYINNFHCSYYFWEVSSVFDDRPLFILNTLLKKKHNNKIKHWLFENLCVSSVLKESLLPPISWTLIPLQCSLLLLLTTSRPRLAQLHSQRRHNSRSREQAWRV